MESVVDAIRWGLEALLRPLDGLAPWASLAIIAAVTAVAMLVIVRHTSPQRAVRRARAQMAASIFEMRLYLDHPLQLLRAQARLFAWTAIYIACLLPSLLVIAAPLGLLYLHLEIRHGVAPFTAPATAVIRVEVDPHASLRDVAISGNGPVAVTARVHADHEHALYARVAIPVAGTHGLTVRVGSAAVPIELAADAALDVVSPQRASGIAQLWALGAQPAIETDAIRAIAIPYPARASSLAVPWWLYWLGLATVFALLLRGRLGVAI